MCTHPFALSDVRSLIVSRKNLAYTVAVSAAVFWAMSKYGGHLTGQRHGS